MVLKGCFYVRVSLYRLCEFSIFGVRASFGMDTSHIFPQGMLAIIPLIGDGIGVVLSRACTGFWVGPPLCSVAVRALLGVGSAPWLLD